MCWIWPFCCYPPNDDFEPFLGGGGGGMRCLPKAMWWRKNQGSVDSKAVGGGCAERRCCLSCPPPTVVRRQWWFPFLQSQFSSAQVTRGAIESPDHLGLTVHSPISSPTSWCIRAHCPCSLLPLWKGGRRCYVVGGETHQSITKIVL